VTVRKELFLSALWTLQSNQTHPLYNGIRRYQKPKTNCSTFPETELGHSQYMWKKCLCCHSREASFNLTSVYEKYW